MKMEVNHQPKPLGILNCLLPNLNVITLLFQENMITFCIVNKNSHNSLNTIAFWVSKNDHVMACYWAKPHFEVW